MKTSKRTRFFSLDMKILRKFMVLLLLLGIVVACKKNPDQEKPERILDVNTSFVIKPEPGKEFIVNLYYSEQKDEPFYERAADEVFKYTLSTQDIENGFTQTLRNLKESTFMYLTAYVDVDGDGQVSEGDIAACYNRKSLRDVMKGLTFGDNVAYRPSITMEMDEIYSTLLSSDAEFTFPIEVAPSTKLTFSLYYADQAEPRFFDRDPDVVREKILTWEEIQEGVKLSVAAPEGRAYVYATAYLDLDGNGELNHGDIAVGYNGKPLHEIFNGTQTADNMAGVWSATWSMGEWFEEEDAPAKDIDGNVYTTVIIGNKEWMAENLKVTRYRNGSPIPSGWSNAQWTTPNRVGAYAVYPFEGVDGIGSEAEMITKYGLLYNGFAVVDTRGLAPVGWRVATDDDFKELELAIGFTVEQTDNTGWRGEGSPKLRSTTGWTALAGTDNLGFKALPAGAREQNGTYSFMNVANVRANFWTSTPDPAGAAIRSFRRILEDTRPTINRGVVTNSEGYSVRCVRDVD